MCLGTHRPCPPAPDGGSCRPHRASPLIMLSSPHLRAPGFPPPVSSCMLPSFPFYMKKNVPWHIRASRAVACDMFLLRASAHPRGAFIFHRTQFPMKYKTALGKRSCLRFPRVVLCGLPSHHTLNRYPTPHIVSIYCGFAVLNSIFSRIFLICTVTVAISPNDSISQISRKSSSLVNTWFGFCAKKGQQVKFLRREVLLLAVDVKRGGQSYQS